MGYIMENQMEKKMENEMETREYMVIIRVEGYLLRWAIV